MQNTKLCVADRKTCRKRSKRITQPSSNESVGHVEKKIRRANEVDFADIGFRGKDLVNAEIRWVPLSSTSPFSFAFQISLNSP